MFRILKTTIFQILVFVFLLAISTLFLACNSGKEKSNSNTTVYYIDAENGDDTNDGLSLKKPWATLKNVNNKELLPGTKVLLKSGTKYEGPIVFTGNGKASAPIEITSYGGDEKAIIEGKGKELYAVKIYNANYIELRNLEITNTGSEEQARRRGVIVEAENCGLSKHIILDQLYIHNVNGTLVKKKGGGSAILWQNHGKEKNTTFDSLIIENCHIKDCARNAINSRGYTNRENWYPSTNVIIRNNLIEGVPGDGIVPIGTDGAVIEYNVMRDCPDVLPFGDAAAGIWPWSADNTVVQFNEVSGHKAKWDGQGFDSDWNCQNTIIQYNYSHDNYGGFLLVCNNGENYGKPNNLGTTNTIVRYNISINDGIRPYETARRGYFSPLMHISGPVEGTVLHHNMFMVPKKTSEKIDRTVVQMDNWGGPWPMKTFFHKNNFLLEEDHKMEYGKAKETFAKQNGFADKKFPLLESNDQEIPSWASDHISNIDSEYREKLIQTFFNNNNEIQNQIRSLEE